VQGIVYGRLGWIEARIAHSEPRIAISPIFSVKKASSIFRFLHLIGGEKRN
jgi:hypothetical protein